MSKVVKVYYRVSDVFVIPKDINLEDETQVKEWCVKYNTLYIYLIDGREFEIGSEGWIDEQDYKYPDEVEIQKGEDWEHLLEDEEEEEKKSK